jgi:PPOX class probable F420-dependent enzyme
VYGADLRNNQEQGGELPQKGILAPRQSETELGQRRECRTRPGGGIAVALTEEQRAFLEAPRFAVAATISTDGLPHQTVMWYALDGDELILSTPRGSLKHRHLLRDPRLSVCVEDGFRYVSVSGRVRIEEEPEAARELYGRIGARYRRAMPRPSAGKGPPPRLGSKTAELLSRERVTLRLTIERVRSNGFG